MTAPIKKFVKVAILSLVSIALMVVLSSCPNLAQGSDLKSKISDDVTVANATEVTIRVQPETSAMGSTSPYGSATVKKGVSFTIAAAVDSSYAFDHWEATGGGTVVFENASSSETKATVTQTAGDIVIVAVCDARPKVSASEPFAQNGIFTTQAIKFYFSENIDPESVYSTADSAWVDDVFSVTYPGWEDSETGLPEDISDQFNVTISGNIVTAKLKDTYTYGTSGIYGQFRSSSLVSVSIKNVKDLEGNAMKESYGWTFRTGSEFDKEPPTMGDLSFKESGGIRTVTNGSDINFRNISITFNGASDNSGAENIYTLKVKETDSTTSVVHTNTVGYSNPCVYTITTSGDGNKTLLFTLIDASDNETAEADGVTLTLNMDQTLPVPSFSFTDSTTYAKNASGIPSYTSVRVTAGATDTGGSGPAFYAFTAAEGTPGSWTAYAALSSSPIALPSGSAQGEQNLYYYVKDAAGNIAYDRKTITVDTVAPAVTAFTVNSGTAYTNSASVTLPITATDATSGIVEYKVTEETSTPTADWIPNAGNISIASSSFGLTGTDGAKTVYVYVKDAAGNVGVNSDGIGLDTADPTGSVAANEYATSTSTTLTLNASDTYSGVTDYVVTETPGEPTSGWGTTGIVSGALTSYARSFTLSSGDGDKYVYFYIKDAAGNINGYSDMITLDTAAPENVTGLTASLVSGGKVKLTWTDSTSSDFDHVSITSSPAGVNTTVLKGEQTYTTPKLTHGTSYIFTVKAVDKAGNSSGGVTASNTPDEQPPTVTSVYLATSAVGSPGNTYCTDDEGDINLYFVSPSSDLAQIMFDSTSDLDTATTAEGTWLPYTGSPYAVRLSTTVQGTKTVKVYLKDTVGNETTATYDDSIILDSQEPNDVTNYTALAIAGAKIKVDWTDSVSADFDHVVINSSPSGVTNQSVTHDTETYTTAALTNGQAYTFTIQAVDTAGNISAGVTTLSVTADGTAPPATDIPNAPAVARNSGARVTITWDENDASTEFTRVYITSTNAAFSPVYVAKGTKTYTTGALNETICTFSIQAADAAGNMSAVKTSSNVTPDGTAPSVTTMFLAKTSAATSADTYCTDTDGYAYLIFYAGLSSDIAAIKFDAASDLNTATTPEGTWIDFDGDPKYYQVRFTTTAQGTKAVKVYLRDTAGNETTATKDDDITFDTDPPSNAAVTAVAAAGAKVKLTWTDPTAGDFHHMHITCAAASIDTTIASGLQTYTSGTLTNGESYQFVVKSVDTAGNESSGTTTTSVTVDGTAPDNASVTAVATEGGTITLTWTDPTAGDFHHMHITCATASIDTTVASGVQTYTSGALTNGSSYQFVVKSVDTVGNESSGTTTASVTADSTPPSDSDATNPQAVAIADAKFTVTWTETSATDFTRVLVTSTPSGVSEYVTKGVKTLTTASLTDGTSYKFSVQAVDAAGNKSAAVTMATGVTADGTDPANSDVSGINVALNADAKATITWTEADAATDFTRVYITSTNAAFTPVYVTKGTKTYTTGTLNETACTFSIQAADAAGNLSAAVTSGSVTPDGTDPANSDVSGINVALNADAKATITWTEADAATDFTRVYITSTNAAFTPVYVTKGTKTYTTGTLNETACTFSIQAADAAGNLSAAVTSGSETPDGTDPSVTTMFLATAADATAASTYCTDTDGYAYLIFYTGLSSDIAAIKFDAASDLNTATTSEGTWIDFDGDPKYYYLRLTTTAQGSKAVKVYLKDAVGNETSTTVDDSIILDTLAPTVSTASATNLGAFSATIVEAGSGVAKVLYWNNTVDGDATDRPTTPSEMTGVNQSGTSLTASFTVGTMTSIDFVLVDNCNKESDMHTITRTTGAFSWTRSSGLFSSLFSSGKKSSSGAKTTTSTGVRTYTPKTVSDELIKKAESEGVVLNKTQAAVTVPKLKQTQAAPVPAVKPAENPKALNSGVAPQRGSETRKTNGAVPISRTETVKPDNLESGTAVEKPETLDETELVENEEEKVSQTGFASLAAGGVPLSQRSEPSPGSSDEPGKQPGSKLPYRDLWVSLSVPGQRREEEEI